MCLCSGGYLFPIRRHRSVSGAVEFAGYDVVVLEYNRDD